MKNEKFSFELVGWDELVEELKILPDNVKKNGINNVLKKESLAIETKAKTLVRKKTGRLGYLIRAKKRRTKSKNFFKYTVGVPKGENRKDKFGAFYAAFIEFGTSLIEEKSYLREALKESAPNAISGIVSSVKNEINASLKRHNARAKKRAAK